jgi:hypothetical protein
MSSNNLAACVPLLIFAALNSLIAQTKGPTLVGAWEFTATPEPTTYATATSVEGLATFTSDGTVVETDTMSILGRVSSGHGIAFHINSTHCVPDWKDFLLFSSAPLEYGFKNMRASPCKVWRDRS